MAKPKKLVQVSSFLGDGAVVGIGMPMIIKFGRPIPADYRDDVQRRMTVRSDPPQEGIWHWVSATEVRYRPKEFWKPGTKITYEVRAGGLPMGDGWYGARDLTVDLKIGSSIVMVVDNKTKQMTVTRTARSSRRSRSASASRAPRRPAAPWCDREAPQDGLRHLRGAGPEAGLPPSTSTTPSGSPGAASSSTPRPGRWRTRATPTSRTAASTCPTRTADWLFDQTQIGDPVTVKGTEASCDGNGWTDWNMSWDEYVKGSALPVRACGRSPSVSPSGATARLADP